VLHRRRGQRQRQPIAVAHLVVVPDGAAGPVLTSLQLGKPRDALAPRRSAPRRQRERRRQAAVAIEADQAIDRESRRERRTAARRPPRGRHQERQRRREVRRDPRHGAAIHDGLTHPPQIEGLQISQSPVQNLEVVRARAAADVPAIEQCNGEAALRRVVRNAYSIYTCADDDEVERCVGETAEIACNHRKNARGSATHAAALSDGPV
jgi:hypothetical protein